MAFANISSIGRIAPNYLSAKASKLNRIYLQQWFGSEEALWQFHQENFIENLLFENL